MGMAEHQSQQDTTLSFASSLPLYRVTLRGQEGERRLPVDVIKTELLSLPPTIWIDFSGDELGDPPVYAMDLMRRMVPLNRQWIARANVRFIQNLSLIEAARTSGCRGLIFNGAEISAQHLTSEPTGTTESLSQLATRFRTLTENGVLSIIRMTKESSNEQFVFVERRASGCHIFRC
jgi:hypothetical protein